jgi:hypothetical protein
MIFEDDDDDYCYYYGTIGRTQIGRETEVLGDNLLQCHFVHHISHMTLPGLERGSPP